MNIDHIISGKLSLEHDAADVSDRPKYKLDSDQHHVLLRSLQKNDPGAEFENSQQLNVPPGDDNFDHRMLVGMKLIIPCATWVHDDARSICTQSD